LGQDVVELRLEDRSHRHRMKTGHGNNFARRRGRTARAAQVPITKVAAMAVPLVASNRVVSGAESSFVGLGLSGATDRVRLVVTPRKGRQTAACRQQGAGKSHDLNETPHCLASMSRAWYRRPASADFSRSANVDWLSHVHSLSGIVFTTYPLAKIRCFLLHHQLQHLEEQEHDDRHDQIDRPKAPNGPVAQREA
jgi:hypothetical protein